MYELESENLTHASDIMGRAYSYPNWRKFFNKMDAALEYAKADYKASGGSRLIFWQVNSNNGFSSQDLGNVMYHIREVKTED